MSEIVRKAFVAALLPTTEIVVHPLEDFTDIIALPANRSTYGIKWIVIGAPSLKLAESAAIAYFRSGQRLQMPQSLVVGSENGNEEKTANLHRCCF